MATWTEYRAIIKRPVSLLDTPEDQARGYAIAFSAVGRSKAEVRSSDYLLRHGEETLATLIGWQVRKVQASDWRDQEDASK